MSSELDARVHELHEMVRGRVGRTAAFCYKDDGRLAHVLITHQADTRYPFKVHKEWEGLGIHGTSEYDTPDLFAFLYDVLPAEVFPSTLR